MIVTCGVAPSPASLVSSLAGPMLPVVLVSEGQLVVTLAGVLVIPIIARIVVARIVVARIVVAGITGISTVAATVVTPPSEEVLQTEEPDPDLVLPGSLASPPATVTA